jgi:hypothetical protein
VNYSPALAGVQRSISGLKWEEEGAKDIGETWRKVEIEREDKKSFFEGS